MDLFLARKFVSSLLLPPTGFLVLALVGWLLAAWPGGRGGGGRRRRTWRRDVDRGLFGAGRGLDGDGASGRSGRWRQRLGLGLILVGIGLAIAATTWPVARLPANWLEAPYVDLDPAGQRLPVDRALAWQADPARAPQAIVMLTGGASTDGPRSDVDERLTGDTIERAIHTARLAKLTGLPVLVSGGRLRPTRDSLAGFSRTFIEKDLGVPVRWLEETSVDTPGNALYTARMLAPEGVHRVLLVSHATHMRRAQGLFEAQGFTVIPAPCCFIGRSATSAARWFWPTGEAMLASYTSSHEILGLIWYGLKGWPGSKEAH